jgi:hypothetical protein
MHHSRNRKITYRSKLARAVTLMATLLMLIANLALTPAYGATPPTTVQTSSNHEQSDPPGVGYATDAGRTLIRWFWPSNDPNNQVAAFRVYRREGNGPEIELATVTPVVDQAAGVALLNAWPNAPGEPELYDQLMTEFASRGVSDIASLRTYLLANSFVARELADTYYPVAQLIGWGYLDTNFTSGASYTYSILALQQSGPEVGVGQVTLTAGQPTPLAAPSGLQATDLSSLVENQDDWTAAQKNRRFDRTVYLKWDDTGAANNSATAYPQAWVTGYDIYRAPQGSDDFVRINGKLPVQPLPATIPLTVTAPVEGIPAVTGEGYADEKLMVAYYYADETPTYGEWKYRIAARDLLGQPREWPSGSTFFSGEEIAEAPDFIPPPAPSGLTAEILPGNDKIALSWTITPTSDLASFRIERALSTPTTDAWQLVGTVQAGMPTTWIDTDATMETVRWYRVQAVDNSPYGNRSFFAGPVQAVLHDITPPPAPQLKVRPCNPAQGGQSSGCLNATASADTTRIRVYCKLSQDGDNLLLAEVPGNQLTNFDLASVYSPPLPLENISCYARSVDAHGNIGLLSLPVTVSLPLGTATAPQPIITDIATLHGGANGWTAKIQWESLAAAGLEKFRISREYEAMGIPLVETFEVGPDVREYSDTTVLASKTYRYTVSAVLKQVWPFNGKTANSLPRTFRIVSEGQRVLTEASWKPISWSAANGTQLQWNPDPKARNHWAVFRSVRRDSDYIQITPAIQGATGYTDTSAKHNRYWYVVVEFDERTGEPVRYTRPNSVAYGLALVDTSAPLPAPVASAAVATAPATNVSLPSPGNQGCIPKPLANAPLRFGDGFEVKVTELINSNPAGLEGFGQLRVNPQSGAIDIPVHFTSITVGDASNHVCTGKLTVDVVAALGKPISVMPATGLSYQVSTIVAYPWFGMAGGFPGRGAVQVQLPDSLRQVNAANAEADAIALPEQSTLLHSDMRFTYQRNFGAVLLHSCATPTMSFNLETLPTKVVPLGMLTIDSTGIAMGSSCMRYLERYSGQYGPRPAPSNNTSTADSNDGFLRGTFAGGAATITRAGLSGSFSTDEDMAWHASYPFGFLFKVNGLVQVMLQQSQIKSGSLGAGMFEMSYERNETGHNLGTLSSAFSGVALDPKGAGLTTVSPSDAVSWRMPGGFTLPAGAWELYLGTVTTAKRPASVATNGKSESAMWSTRPFDEVEVGLMDKADLEPGLNRRLSSTPLLWANCSGPAVTFDAAVNTYVRHGGVSERQKAKLNGPLNLHIHGYDASLENFELSLLDNYIFDSKVSGEVRLQGQADIDISLIDMWFDGGCVGGGKVPASEANKTLGFWQIATQINAVEFREQAPPANLPEWDAMLWTIGKLEVPHLAAPIGSQAMIAAETSFDTAGDVDDTEVLYNRPDYTLDGFTFLLEDVALSHVGEGPAWDAQATIAAPPLGNDWNQRGYVGLQGVFVTPYFGPAANKPGVCVLGWNNYVGFTQPLQAAKTWVDLDAAAVEYNFDQLVYAQDPAAPDGLFVDFHQLKIADATGNDMFSIDSAAIIKPHDLSLQLGQSSGVALARAIAEATGANLDNTPTMSNWSNKLGMAPGDRDRYQELLGQAWGYFGGQTYAQTSDILHEHEDQLLAKMDISGFGAQVAGTLASQDFQLKRLHGEVVLSGGSWQDLQIDGFDMNSFVQVKRPNESPMVAAKQLPFEVSRHGDFVFEQTGITSSLFESQVVIDTTLRINPTLPQFEGGITLHSFNLANIHVIQGSAVVGVGAQLNYVGASFDASMSTGAGPSTSMGGSVLFGTINPTSVVLQNHFPDLMQKISSDVGQSGPMSGFYLRVYGDTTIYSNGCILQVNVGAEMAAWYWATGNNGGSAYGGKLRGFVHGDLLCIVSARGDLSLVYWRTPDGKDHLQGTAWVAGGIGFCEPETWTSWESRWWDDDWCLTGGAYASLTYSGSLDDPDDGSNMDNWDVQYSIDGEL